MTEGLFLKHIYANQVTTLRSWRIAYFLNLSTEKQRIIQFINHYCLPNRKAILKQQCTSFHCLPNLMDNEESLCLDTFGNIYTYYTLFCTGKSKWFTSCLSLTVWCRRCHILSIKQTKTGQKGIVLFMDVAAHYVLCTIHNVLLKYRFICKQECTVCK